MERRIHIRVYQLDAGQKFREHAFDWRVEVIEILLHRCLDVLAAKVGRGDDGQGRFQLGGDVLLEVGGSQPDELKRHQHQADGQHGHQEVIAQHQGDKRPNHKEQQGQGAYHGELDGPAGHLENALGLLDLPAQERFLFAPGTLVDLGADALGPAGDPLEHPLGEVHGGDMEEQETSHDQSDAGDQLNGSHAGSPPFSFGFGLAAGF